MVDREIFDGDVRGPEPWGNHPVPRASYPIDFSRRR